MVKARAGAPARVTASVRLRVAGRASRGVGASAVGVSSVRGACAKSPTFLVASTRSMARPPDIEVPMADPLHLKTTVPKRETHAISMCRSGMVPCLTHKNQRIFEDPRVLRGVWGVRFPVARGASSSQRVRARVMTRLERNECFDLRKHSDSCLCVDHPSEPSTSRPSIPLSVRMWKLVLTRKSKLCPP